MFFFYNVKFNGQIKFRCKTNIWILFEYIFWLLFSGKIFYRAATGQNYFNQISSEVKVFKKILHRKFLPLCYRHWPMCVCVFILKFSYNFIISWINNAACLNMKNKNKLPTPTHWNGQVGKIWWDEWWWWWMAEAWILV